VAKIKIKDKIKKELKMGFSLNELKVNFGNVSYLILLIIKSDKIGIKK
jgi:hypothetical protein